jgi:hypothetical protein
MARRSIRSDRIRLIEAIRRIGRECGLEIEVAPGMSDPEIVMRYDGMTGMEMLLDLGPRFGFTAFDEGEGRVLIIPTTDPTVMQPPDRAKSGPPSGGTYERAETAG